LDDTSTATSTATDDYYYDDAKFSVASLRDEKNAKDLDSKYQDYCNRSKVPLPSFPLVLVDPLLTSLFPLPTKVGVEDFDLLRVIGKGSFGKVTLVRKKNSGNLYAMKVLSKSHILKRKQIEHTKTERRVLATINHPFIVKLHYAFQVSGSSPSSLLFSLTLFSVHSATDKFETLFRVRLRCWGRAVLPPHKNETLPRTCRSILCC
jgi:serine/threonine protein kinase